MSFWFVYLSYLKLFFFFWCGLFLKSLLYLLEYCFCFVRYIYLPHCIWDLSFPTRDRTHTPCIGRPSPNHLTTTGWPYHTCWLVAGPDWVWWQSHGLSLPELILVSHCVYGEKRGRVSTSASLYWGLGRAVCFGTCTFEWIEESKQRRGKSLLWILNVLCCSFIPLSKRRHMIYLLSTKHLACEND